MDEALIGIIGVAAGALATGGIQLLIAWRDRRRAARDAARILYASVLRPAYEVGMKQEGKRELDIVEFEEALADWKEYRDRFSSGVNAWQFRAVSSAIHEVSNVRALLKADEPLAPKLLDQCASATNLGRRVLWAAGASRRERREIFKQMERHGIPAVRGQGGEPTTPPAPPETGQ